MEQQQIDSIENYSKYGIDINQVDEETIVIKQTRLVNGYILNQKQLVEIAKDIFPNYHIKPVVYSLEVSTITIDWIGAKMKLYGIKNNDLVKQLAIDKKSLETILNGKTKLSNSLGALFYYYFLTYEINTEVRNQINPII